MRIRSLDIKGFGCLVSRSYQLPEAGAVLVVEDNEHGKSTLAAAILAGLCGLPPRKSGGEKIKLKDALRPWDSDQYGLEMSLEAGGREIIVIRDFARDSFIVRDARTNRDITAELSSDLAEHFLQLPRADYQRVALISGKEVQQFDSLTGIRARLAAVVEGSNNDAGAELALAALDGARFSLNETSIKPATAVKRLADAIVEKEGRSAQLDSSLEAASEDADRLDALRSRQQSLRDKINALDKEQRAARLIEIRNRIAEAEASAAEIAALESEMEGLSGLEHFPAARAQQLTASAARLATHQEALRDHERSALDMEKEREQIRARLSELSRFATASEQDRVALAASAENLQQAQDEVESLRGSSQARETGVPQPVWWTLAGLGLAGALACLALVVLGTLPAVGGAAGTLIGAIAAAAGLTQALRGGRGSEARGKLEQAEKFYEATLQRARMQLSGLAVSSEGADLRQVLARTQQALSAYLNDRAKLGSLETDLVSARRQVSDTTASVDGERQTVQSILAEAGIDGSEDLQSALRQFRDVEAKYRRLCEIRDSLLPALVKRRIAGDVLETMRAEERDLSGGDSPATATARSATAIETERRQCAADLDAASGQIASLERSVGGAVSAYRLEYAGLAEGVHSLKQQLARAERFESAVDTAARVMREVAVETRRRWAAALNERASGILEPLNPDYDTLLFDDSLAFTIRHRADNRVIGKDEIDAQLSTGAKDQIYLAVRIACCGELSKGGESIPIILDDPFIAADDERFASGMRYIVEQLARDHQVIVLSCHKSRHEELATQPWFSDGVTVLKT